MDHLKGQIERITYSSDQSGFAVCKLKVENKKKSVTIVGNMVNPLPGETVALQGEWITHKKFGDQFQVRHYQILEPATRAGIEKYLGSGLIKGIGPVMAGRIVKQFGARSLDIIEKDIERLSEVDGIGTKRIRMIQLSWNEQKEVRSVMLFLQSHGVSTAFAGKIFKVYGQDAVRIVKDDPYRLARDIAGVGFLTADAVARNLGVKQEAPQRVLAGIDYTLLQLADEGHVCYPAHKLTQAVEKTLGVGPEAVQSALRQAVSDNRIVIETIRDPLMEGVKFSRVFLKKFHVCEIGIASNLSRILNAPKSVRKIDITKAMAWVREQIQITLADSQSRAVEKSVAEKVLVITGGPGTGKTTIINAILKILKAAGAKILLAAPTGRAAKRMSEATRNRATTIHRLLDYSMKEGGFKKNNHTPLKCDVLIIDEASMIDTVLMYHLLKAVPSQCTLIFVGDVNQLPSVGPGNVLDDLIESNACCVVTLDTIFRQARKSLIVVNAHKINQGQFPIVANESGKSNFYFIQKDTPEEVLSVIIDMVQNRIPGRFDYDPVADIQVLTPMHRGVVGAGNLNRELQKRLNPQEKSVVRGSREFRVADKVMQIRNNYDKHTYNGDIGRIIDIDHTDQTMGVEFYRRQVVYDFSELDELVLAYAVSVHKAQGSEYPVVVIPVVTQHYILLQRNLIYTAVTRGRRLVVMVGTKKALAMAVRTVKSSVRYTRLAHRLSQL